MSERYSLKFSDVERHPFFEVSNIDAVLRGFHVRQRTDLFAQLMPLININADKVEMDIDKAKMGGMTPTVARGAETPLYTSGGRGKISWESAEFREKVQVTEDQVAKLRKLGTMNELLSAREVLDKDYKSISDRLARRIEWMRRQTLFDNAVVAPDPNGVMVQLLTINHPSFLRPTFGTLWSNTTNADPIDDMQILVRDFLLNSSYEAADVWAPIDALRIAGKTDRFRDYATNNLQVFKGTNKEVANLISMYIAGVTIEEKTQHMPFTSVLLADAAAGQAVVVMEEVEQLEAGDNVIISSFEQQWLYTVASVAGNSVTFTSNLTDAVQAGYMTMYNKSMIPKDKLLVVGKAQMPPDWTGAEPGAERGLEYIDRPFDVCSTLSGFTDLNNRRPGLFSKLRDLTDGDPPSIEHIIGIRALPRVHYINSWMVAKYV